MSVVRLMHQSNLRCFLASNCFIYDCFTQTHTHTHTHTHYTPHIHTHTHTDLQRSPFSDHPYLHSWPLFSALMVILICTHGHPSLHSWSPFSALMATLLCTHGHPSLHSWPPFSALMVTLLCKGGSRISEKGGVVNE